MIFSTDTSIRRIRSTIYKFLPPGTVSWGDFHAEAGRNATNDIEVKWFRPARSAMYEAGEITDPDLEFDETLLLCGWNHFSGDTVAVAAGERVQVEVGHASGGTEGNTYAAVSNVASTDLGGEDFSDTAAWTDVTDALTRELEDLGSYRALFLIYRYLANDQQGGGAFEKQRDYFEAQYEKELAARIAAGIGYDWDSSGAIAEDEKIPAQLHRARSVVVW